MTTTTSTTTTTATAVDRFLAAVVAGEGASTAHLYADGAVLDAVVPNWRFGVEGGAAIAAEYGRWFMHPGELTELHRHPTPGGEVVEYTLAWVQDGVPHSGHHVHVLTLDRAADRIVADHVWCGGRWDAGLLAEMDAASDAS